ncbi:MAG: DNA polymerase III subunit chi [Candidimonas sp.]|nr:MAG: DNA polymerase III subunit chi [Candidimonas sp.]
MTRVDFAFGALNRLHMACDVARKHARAGHRLLVFCGNEGALARFDRLLWGFEPTAFVPHVPAGDPNEADAPIVLTSSGGLPASFLATAASPPPATAGGTSASATSAPDSLPWLLNLDQEVPPQASGFARVLEIVSNRDADKIAARRRWRRYEADGHTLRAHDVSSLGTDGAPAPNADDASG